MNNHIIYKYTAPSGKSYIGQTKNPSKRERAHRDKNNQCLAFARAIAKYGFENFTKTILEENLSLSEANAKEEYYIDLYNTLMPNGYNLTAGGLNRQHADITIEKIKNTISNIDRKGSNSYWFGKELSSEHRTNISNALSGENNPWFGAHHTESTKEKMRKSNPPGKDSRYAKSYYITFPDGQVEIITGLNAFCRDNNLDASTMSRVAMGKYKHHKGFICQFYNITEEV